MTAIMSAAAQRNNNNELWAGSRNSLRAATNLATVATKYYTHFVTARAKARSAASANEWSGVVELRHPLEHQSSGTRELRALLAQSFDLDSEDIKILHWARLH
jgi:hypothetical protein